MFHVNTHTQHKLSTSKCGTRLASYVHKTQDMIVISAIEGM